MSNMPARNRRTARNASSERKGAQSAANLAMQLASAAIWPPSTQGNSPSRRIGNRPRGPPGDARCSRTRRRRGPREIHCPRGRGAATSASTTPRPRRRKRSGRMSLATRASILRSRRVLPPLTAPGRRWSRKWYKPRTRSQGMHEIGNWQAWPIPKGGEHIRPAQEGEPGRELKELRTARSACAAHKLGTATMPWRGLLHKRKKWLLLAIKLITPHWRLPNGIDKIVKSMPCKRGDVRLELLRNFSLTHGGNI